MVAGLMWICLVLLVFGGDEVVGRGVGRKRGVVGGRIYEGLKREGHHRERRIHLESVEVGRRKLGAYCRFACLWWICPKA